MLGRESEPIRVAGCEFCSIAAGEAPAHRVFAADGCVGFLDIRPVFPGHVLVVPDSHREAFGDLAGEEVAGLFLAAQRISAAVERGLGADGTFVALNNRVSQSVPHVHVHVVPRRKKDGLRGFFWPRHPYAGDEEAERVAEKIRAAMR
ncbi:MAG: HIT domain-containing protein [Myxococcales bacterium]|nr:HIT domain-containing protein [Myxococcales bacterium]